MFGSRTHNQQHGGDIDLFIRNANSEQLKIREKIDFITDLIVQIGEQKIDVVPDHPASKNSRIILILKPFSQLRIKLQTWKQ